ncbi:uncharacterized protein AC631_03875 [Debaryomyces fabryi]|uniref:FAD/NAD(P)-binding domain-containing protein n=1 Tax=Debaryomyces fabryi TaxID=58627 RepID=A0A0V1PVT0_9ASCO|nr:uncharacterized protein AC631_03875 [Debaryomyces fabryi]KSA00359.1 hypothetical protein AC631_03875 [Debaryomyces fabryi]CUM57209.1 unnamed protein product [Debaryomyces fabryi]
MSNSEKHIVIIGGSFAGITAAKTIFGHKNKSIRVTLISPSTHAYYTVATPRLITEPEKIEQTIFPIEETLKKHSEGISYKFIHGKVEIADFDKNLLTVEGADGKLTVEYDFLVVASGCRTDNAAFRLLGDHKDTVDSIKKLNKSTKSAKKIIILGGGATGVETAGELGSLYGKEKDIILYTGLVGPLAPLGESKSKAATNKLTALGVKVINNKRSTSFDENGTRSKVIFKDGSSDDADVVIPAYGVTPNSEFLDKKFLDNNGYLKTDKYFRVEGHNNVLGLGDILSIGENTLVNLSYVQKATFESVVDLEFFGNKNSKLKPYSPIKTTILVPISRNGGIGLMFGWSAPNFLVKFLKAKDFMIPKASEGLA